MPKSTKKSLMYQIKKKNALVSISIPFLYKDEFFS